MPSDDLMIRALAEAIAAVQRAYVVAVEAKRSNVASILRNAETWARDAAKVASRMPIEVRGEQEVSNAD